MKGQFLLEVGSEEIPAGFIRPALASLSDLFARAMQDARVSHGSIETFATPRRMILHCVHMQQAQESREVEKTGPQVSAAYDEQGKPTKAAIGFARSQGVEVEDLIVVEGPKGAQVAIRRTEHGRPTIELLAEVIPGLLEKITFPKTMRWMDLDVRFARPIHWIVALFDGQTIPFSYGNVQSGNLSRGHRFTHPQDFPVTRLEDLREGLERQNVHIDPQRRKKGIEEKARELASQNGFQMFDDPDLLEEVTFLVESAYPIMGQFSSEFLELPASILITCMKKHQRYFSVQDSKGRIQNRFIAVNNTPVRDPLSSAKGHQRVLKARLEDARFYYLEDRKEPLIARLEALKGVVFHSKLGTAFEKVERFTGLARSMGKKLAPDKMSLIERACLLCKCDLETGIVYEFPELQGIIGSYYARLDGEDEAVSSAVREHYLPAHAGDRMPEGIVGSIVSIADRIDTIAGCFSVGLIPSGAADPYALRRHSLAIIQILINLDRPVDIPSLVSEALDQLASKRTRDDHQVKEDVLDFIRTRFVYFHTSRGFPLDVVEAAVRARFHDVVDARKRVEALDEWKAREDFDAIMIGFKRVVNILKNTPETGVSEALFEADEERALFKSFSDVRARAVPLIDQGKYVQALEIIAELKSPIDTFFDKVMVMVDDEALRNNRLGMLREIARLFGRIADFSFIGSTASVK